MVYSVSLHNKNTLPVPLLFVRCLFSYCADVTCVQCPPRFRQRNKLCNFAYNLLKVCNWIQVYSRLRASQWHQCFQREGTTNGLGSLGRAPGATQGSLCQLSLTVEIIISIITAVRILLASKEGLHRWAAPIRQTKFC